MSPFHNGMNFWQRRWLSDRLHRKSQDAGPTVPYQPAPRSTPSEPDPKPRKHPDIAKVLRLKPTPVKALKLLEEAACKDSSELVEVLLAAIPRDQLNNTPRNSSSALEKFVDRSYINLPGRTSGNEEHLKGVELLLDAGARWNPTTATIRATRRDILQHDARYIVQLLRLLLYTAHAADTEQFLELCRSNSLDDKIATVDRPLVDELKALRKSKPIIRTSAVAAAGIAPELAEPPQQSISTPALPTSEPLQPPISKP